MLEFGSEEAFEVVFDDENAKEIGIAAGTEDVPGKGSDAKADEGDGMKAAKRIAPAFGEDRPQQNSAAGKNDCGGPFRENGEAQEEAEENESEPGVRGMMGEFSFRVRPTMTPRRPWRW